MGTTRWDERFFASTRGQVVGLLRRGPSTVDALADALALTDNAVRSHLAALERDGFVAQGEPRRTGGKPAFTYTLTPAADRLFPKPYGAMLTELLDALATRVPPATLDAVLREVGHRLAASQPAPAGDATARIAAARKLLGDLGGVTDLESAGDGYLLQGCNCPFAAAVEGSPSACLMVETLLTDLIGLPVRQLCDPGPPPRCRFAIGDATPPVAACVCK